MRWIQWVVAVVVVLAVQAPSASAQVVFNEILLQRSGANPTVNQIVELKNAGSSSVNIGGWVFCHQFNYSSAIPSGTTIPAGGLLVIHFNQAGTNSSTDIFFPGDQIGTTSDLGLYVNASNFASAANMRAFVQFGGVPAAGRQDVAQAASLWTSGTFVPSVAPGHSIELCAAQANLASSYVDQGAPTIGAQNGCGVSTENVSWSRVKALFR